MSEMYFKNILIADLQTHTARLHEFSKGFNVITSKENHVGKSSLLKSLYYTLGAEVEYDPVWDKNSKLYIVSISVNGECYKVARLMKSFAVFYNDDLLLLTHSVSHELAPALERIFQFAVYLPNKDSKKIELAPPAFTFMPYYIDQDKGWSGLYDSFAHIDQFKKDDRAKSLYYHLNIYTKSTVELMAKRDELKDKLLQLQADINRIHTVLEALSTEIQNLIPADTLQELEEHLQIPKERIEVLVSKLGGARNTIQQLEISLQQHQHQLDVVQEFHRLKKSISTSNKDTIHACPNCGYAFDAEIYNLVRSNYNAINEDYMYQQIQLIIESISKELKISKDNYISTMAILRAEEEAFQAEQDEFNTYVRQRGLQDSIRRFNNQLLESQTQYSETEAKIKAAAKELRKLPSKKDIEEKYREFVRLNIMKLDAWNPLYDGKIKLLKPIKAQGTLENKIILAQFIGLFQTMNYFKSSATRFPFVVDSPRAKEASIASSKDILKMIADMRILPQVILATMDYSDFQSEIDVEASVTVLTEKKKLLCQADYISHSDLIDEIVELLKQA